MNPTEEKVLGIIRAISQDIKLGDQELLSAEYLEAGLIDSLQLIKFVVDLEEEFSIRFSHEDLESKDFRTLKGVAALVEKEKASGGG